MQRFTLEEFKKIHSEWKDSGLSIQDFCAHTGIKESRFYYWKKRVEAGGNLPSPIGGFIPVRPSGNTGRLANAFATSAPSDILCELVYQNGVTLRVTSDMTLEQLRAMVLLLN